MNLVTNLQLRKVPPLQISYRRLVVKYVAALLTHQTECIKIISKGKNVHNPKIVSKLFKGRKSTVLLQKCIGIL